MTRPWLGQLVCSSPSTAYSVYIIVLGVIWLRVRRFQPMNVKSGLFETLSIQVQHEILGHFIFPYVA